MREKIYADYKIKRPYYIFIGLSISAIFILFLFLIWFNNINNECSFIGIIFLFFFGSIRSLDIYFRNRDLPVIYFNNDEIIFYDKRPFIINKNEINDYIIKKKKYLKIFLKDKKPFTVNLYHLTYEKIDYVEGKLNDFINNGN